MSSSIHGTSYAYASELLSLGLLFLEQKDAIREGDGDRDTNVWKFFLPLFSATGHKNYANEAFTYLKQCFLTLPPHLANQVKWSRFVNTSGLPGRNISCDLFMEHLNRQVKQSIMGLGANKSEEAIITVGKAIGTISDTLHTFDSELEVSKDSGKHTKNSNQKDLHTVIRQLCEADVFNKANKNINKSFSNLTPNLIRSLDEKVMRDWLAEKFSLSTTAQNSIEDDMDTAEESQEQLQ